MSKAKKGQKEGGVTYPKKADFECVLDEDAVTVENNGKFYELSMDARSFKPEEVKIRITATHVIIEGLHETDEEITECNEEIVIPEGVVPSTIEVLMNSNGVLRIRGPIKLKEVDLPCTETTRTVTTTETTEKTKVKKSTVIDESSEEVKVVETNVMDPSTEAKILQDKKFVDSTKDIVTKDGKLELNIDVRGRKEEDIKVSVSKRIVAIQVVDKESKDRSKEIHKKFLIPDGVDPTSFRTLLKKGVLTVSMDDPKVTAPPKATPPPKAAPPPKPAPPPVQEPPKPEPPVPLESKVVEPREVAALERRCEDITKQVVKTENKKFEAKVNVSGYKAEELRVKVTKKIVIVHTETRTMTRQFNKKIVLPAGVNPDSVVNSLTPSDGILTISAPITDEPPSEPVEVTPQLDLANTTTTTESQFEDISKQISPGKFEVEMDVSAFKPEEIEVKVMKSIVTIKGQQSVQQSQSSSSRQFFKKFNIPQGVKAEQIKFTFTTKGTLRVYSEQTQTQTTQETTQLSKSGSTIKPEIIGSGLGSTSGGMVASGDNIKFERKVDAAGYKEDEIKVSIANGWITVTGKQQMGPELNFQTRQFTKKFSVPYGVKPDTITCNLQPSGTLVISASP